MYKQEGQFSSSASTSPFQKESGYFAFRDPQYLEDELFLDDIVEAGETERALPLEKSYLSRLDRLTYASAGLARVAYKAIAVSQYARQIDVAPRGYKDTSYKNIGLLLDKTLAEKNRLRYGPEGWQYYQHLNVRGLLAEIAVFTALSYDSKLKHPLTGRPRTSPAHHVLPSSVEEDRGGVFSLQMGSGTLDAHLGYDLKAFTPDETTPVIPLQIKTSLIRNDKHYVPEITVIPVDEIAATDIHNDSVLPSMLRDEAFGRRTRASRLQLTATNRTLDSMLQFEQQ